MHSEFSARDAHLLQGFLPSHYKMLARGAHRHCVLIKRTVRAKKTSRLTPPRTTNVPLLEPSCNSGKHSVLPTLGPGDASTNCGRRHCSQGLSHYGDGVNQNSRVLTGDCWSMRCCLQTRDESCERTLSKVYGLCHSALAYC